MSYNDYELFYLISEGVFEAKDVLFNKYVRYVYFLANDRIYLLVDPSLMIEDIYQEGLIALSDALNSYNVNLDIPFVSYMRLIVIRRFSKIYKKVKSFKDYLTDFNFEVIDLNERDRLKILVYRDLIDNDLDKVIYDSLVYGAKARHLARYLDIDIKYCYNLIRNFKNRYKHFYKIIKE